MLSTYESGREAGAKATQFSAGLLVGIGLCVLEPVKRGASFVIGVIGFLVTVPLRIFGFQFEKDEEVCATATASN